MTFSGDCNSSQLALSRVTRLIEDFTALIGDALSTPAARQKLSCDPDVAADLAVTFTRGLAVMEPAYRNPQHLEGRAFRTLARAGRRDPRQSCPVGRRGL
jgi:hypothetical protein